MRVVLLGIFLAVRIHDDSHRNKHKEVSKSKRLAELDSKRTVMLPKFSNGDGQFLFKACEVKEDRQCAVGLLPDF
jgi:hypothetical protein